jgi:hypothetical protein
MQNENQPQPVPTDKPTEQGQVVQPSSEITAATTPLQPAVVVNGQTVQPTTPIPSIETDQTTDQKPSKWLYFFIVLGVLQAIGVALFFFIIEWAIQQARAGVSGTEFIGLLVEVTLVPAVGLIAFINLIGLPIYMRRHKPHGKGLVFSILSLSVSVILALYGAYSVYQLRVAVPKHVNELHQQTQARRQQFAADNANPEITKDEAIQLLKTCQLKGFYYTNQTDKSDPANGGWGELSPTGVVLTKLDGQPYRISIADRLIPELVPIAREAQKTCGGEPQFWHDGSYEQWKDGHWYFNGQVVN